MIKGACNSSKKFDHEIFLMKYMHLLKAKYTNIHSEAFQWPKGDERSLLYISVLPHNYRLIALWECGKSICYLSCATAAFAKVNAAQATDTKLL